jgi:hypothetical protein
MVIFSIMEKRPTIKRLVRHEPRPLMRPTTAVVAEKIADDVA